ncbi:GGDEF domain-containing protein [Malonomonas rubra]|nr:GGDEF domain-containing protein [Malonomonas rubra]
MSLLISVLLLGGTLMLLSAVVPVGRLILQLPPGPVRTWWQALSILISFFVAGYVSYAILHWGVYEGFVDLIVPLIFFFGALFVLLVCNLSLNTANDIKRIFTLEYESTTDSLMGIYNRRFLEKRLHEEFFRSKRYDFPMSLLMVDIDRFKLVNDRFGHPVGDIVLKRLAELIVTTVRESDVVARYGGEELLLILPHTRGDNAHLLAERLRFAIENTVLVKKGESDLEEDLQVTVSIGVSTLAPELTSSQQLLKQADKALYQAKDQGRNRVVAAPNIFLPEKES